MKAHTLKVLGFRGLDIMVLAHRRDRQGADKHMHPTHICTYSDACSCFRTFGWPQNTSVPAKKEFGTKTYKAVT